MKPLGFTLDEMRELLDLVEAIDGHGDSTSHARLEAYLGAAAERRAELARRARDG